MADGKKRSIRRFAIYHLPSSIFLAALLACGRSPSPSITVIRSQPAAVEVHGLPSRDLAAIRRHPLNATQWQQILRVGVDGSVIPMAGRYAVEGDAIRFTPLYGFDEGRSFSITFDPARIPGADRSERWRKRPLTKVVSFAANAIGRPTAVKAVYPSGKQLPENMLRFYIEFTAPMGRAPALDHIRLIDGEGTHVMDPFLPVDAELWTPDRMRFTLLFDPGRVKRGIKPNRDLGRALVAGRRYSLVIGERWPDGRGRPLQAPYRREFTVVPAIEKPLNQRDWKVEAPKPATRDPLVVVFPWALDFGLLQRALGVHRGGVEVAGEIAVQDAETRWMFTPAEPWTAGDYTLVALTLLEDPAGNRLGRAFEVMRPVTDEREAIEIPFTVK
jgi:hypothetical protein